MKPKLVFSKNGATKGIIAFDAEEWIKRTESKVRRGFLYTFPYVISNYGEILEEDGAKPIN